MKNTKKIIEQTPFTTDKNFVDYFWEKSWTYTKTTVDVKNEPILVLDENFRVVMANESFYKVFQVTPEDTEQKNIFELGNRQWNIPLLRKNLENILPHNTFFKGFEVTREFPLIGHRTMILNARKIYMKEGVTLPPVILLAIEDITEMVDVAKMLARHTKQFELKTKDRMKKLEVYIKKLEKEVGKFKKA
jgi:two-component system CheB/CheR fusion protein